MEATGGVGTAPATVANDVVARVSETETVASGSPVACVKEGAREVESIRGGGGIDTAVGGGSGGDDAEGSDVCVEDAEEGGGVGKDCDGVAPLTAGASTPQDGGRTDVSGDGGREGSMARSGTAGGGELDSVRIGEDPGGTP